MIQFFIPFLEITLLLLIGGTALALVLLPRATMGLAIALGLPLGALLNAFIVFDSTILGIPLTRVSIVTGHLVSIGVLVLLIYKQPTLLMDLERPEKTMAQPRGRIEKTVIAGALVLITMTIVYSLVHAIALPTAQFDSLTNWTMRSRISYEDNHMAFDPTEDRGMAKPQYPFLFHALQITANQGQPQWNDAAANGILYLLSLSTFGALFLMIRKLRGTAQALVAIAVVLSIPLISIHTAQGYADLNLLQYVALSLVCLGMWVESDHERKNRWLILSGVFVAASVWTKSEGLVFGLLPWLVPMAHLCGIGKNARKTALPAVLVAVALAAPWPIFAWIKELSLTPHSSDTMLQFHPEAIKEALLAVFGRGTFGVTWYALIVLVPALIVSGIKKYPGVACRQLPLLFWGILMTAEILFIYLCTPNVRFLLNAESFYRQMMIPAALLILAGAICVIPRSRDTH